MTLRIPVLAALAATLALAAPASAATFVVDEAADPAPGVGCDATGDADTCSLREAIAAANASADPSDLITFEAGLDSVAVSGAGLVLTNPSTRIDGESRNVRVTWSAGAGPLLTIAPAAEGSRVRRLSMDATATGLGPLLRIQGPDIAVEGAVFTDARASAIEISDAGPADPDPNRVSITGSIMNTSAADGVDVQDASRNITISSSRIAANGQSGVRVRTAARNVVVSGSIFFANGGRPILLVGSGNTGAGALGGLRIGPRQPNGTLPLNGSASTGGTVEVFRGNPFGPAPPAFTDAFGVLAGGFARTFGVEPGPGEPLAATLTTSGGGTSEFVPVTVPADIASPGIVSVRAVDTSQIRLRVSEAINPASLDGGAFGVEMAGAPRAIRGISVEGAEVVIDTAGGWREGEAGYLDIAAPGALTDGVGNASLFAGRVRVAAGPGDFTPPRISKIKVSPSRFCPSGVKRCRGPRGTKVTFTTDEEGRFEIAAFRGRKRVGNRTFTKDKAGTYTIKFSGKLRAGRLSRGLYKLKMSMEDEVGNVSSVATRRVRALGPKRSKRSSRRSRSRR